MRFKLQSLFLIVLLGIGTVSMQSTLTSSAQKVKVGPIYSNLAPGSNPSALPGPILIADKRNNRLLIVSPKGKITWEFPQPGNLKPGQSFLGPDDAFFTPNGKDIITNQESNQTISLISIAQHKIIWTYGHAGVTGNKPNYLNTPDDAMVLPKSHTVISPDIVNCSILLIPAGSHHPIHRYGQNTTNCMHNPPYRFGSPNGAFPMTNGKYLITEINGDWVDEMSLSGKIGFMVHPPGVAYPSDTNEINPNRFLTVDYSNPGQIIEFNRQGKLLWRFAPTGPNALNQPSLAEPLPNGDIISTDDHNNRIIVINPKTNKIVWQYGHTGVPGAAPGYLRVPDGLDLAPPYSFLIRHKSTMGQPPKTFRPLSSMANLQG